MRLFDLFERSRPRCARPGANRVRCAVELLESRLALSATDPLSTTLPPVVPPPVNPTVAVAPVIPPAVANAIQTPPTVAVVGWSN